MEGIGAAVRRPRGIPAPAGGMSSGDAPPISLLVLQKEKRAVHGPKRKNATAGRSAQAQPSCRRRGWARGSLGYTLRRFSLPLAWWLMGLLQRADEDIGPYGNAESHSPAVGADAHIRPLVQTPTTARVARSEAERAEGGTSGTLVAEEILGALQRETVKEALVKCVLAPRPTTAPAPRESAIKPVPHHAAPVGQSP